MDLQKGTILVTGANGGLGNAIVSQIISNAELVTYNGIFTVRNAEAAIRFRATLESSKSAPVSSKSYEIIPLDLSRLDNVREVAATINTNVEARTIPPISAIILNAGYEEFGEQTWTEDSLDTTFVVNYLSHWLLTLLLLQSMDRDRGRIIWISSWSQKHVAPGDRHNIMNGSFQDSRYKTMITDDLEPLAKGTWSPNIDGEHTWAAGYRRYGASKMCGVAMIHELQRRLDQDPVLNNVSVLAVDPGGMATGIVRHSNWLVRVLVFRIFAGMLAGLLLLIWPNGTWRTPHKSARDVLAAALNDGPPPLSERPKGLYLNGSELGDYNFEAKDPKKGRAIWEGSVRFARLKADEIILKDWM
ncbi:NAD(P)-binding protein [Annulohypoxylon truncatum]|uniref:NAD(P)-binding protein n=1 Tax=Annulohypoxylon truncatum TaxID=327061 RepID=UPI0020082D61|nr:NAD(P)-binding protein [Annulohypoxylon truncatum]KAI1210113.1 NAD(P)-binding protein [Annulohypoxylon truncatum]